MESMEIGLSRSNSNAMHTPAEHSMRMLTALLLLNGPRLILTGSSVPTPMPL